MAHRCRRHHGNTESCQPDAPAEVNFLHMGEKLRIQASESHIQLPAGIYGVAPRHRCLPAENTQLPQSGGIRICRCLRWICRPRLLSLLPRAYIRCMRSRRQDVSIFCVSIARWQDYVLLFSQAWRRSCGLSLPELFRPHCRPATAPSWSAASIPMPCF